MKITKVKLNNQVVLMQRDSQEGYLLHGQKEKKQQESIKELLAEKQKNFAMSLIGKTLVKDNAFKIPKDATKQEKGENQQKRDNLLLLKQFFEYTIGLTHKAPKDLTPLKKLTKAQLQEYLAHKFAEGKPLLYAQKTKSLNLLDELYTALQHNKDKIEAYKLWADWFIGNKQHFLAKSIINNTIKTTSTPLSKRQQTLNKLAEQMVNHRQINLDELYNKFAPVLKQWQINLATTEKYTLQEIENLTTNDKKEVDYPKDFFEFKRTLKQALKTQQTMLYKAGEFNNPLLEQYSLELTKYLERYFPLKKSGRRLTLKDIHYYLDEKTIQQTLAQQFENATKQYLLQQGKYISYALGEQITSQDLQQIKIQEAFALQFINSCGFAASNLRNVIDPSAKGDILTQTDFIQTLECVLADSKQKNAGIHRLAQFLFSQSFDFDTQQTTTNHTLIIDELKKDNQYLNVTNAIRSAIYNIRNNTIHFNHQALQNIFTVEQYTSIELEQDNSLKAKQPTTYNQQPLLQQLFNHELENLNAVFAEKIRTSGILDYYPTDEVIKHLKNFTLNPKPLPFIPGFKKVFNWGVTYQYEKKDYLGLQNYVEKTYTQEAKDIIADKAYQARYNLLALVYEQRFMATFLTERQDFAKAVNDILVANEQRAQEKPKKSDQQKQAFKEITAYDVNQIPEDYLKAIQSELINEENKKRDEGKLEADQTGHYQQFIWQLFVKGFDNYLNNHPELAFIKNLHPQFDDTTQQQTANQQHQQVEKLKNSIQVSSQIKPNDNHHLGFWLFCKMLDANYLNQLHNQLSKWQQAQKSITTQLNADLETFQQIISLNILTSDITPAAYQTLYKTKADYFKELVPFTSLKEDKLNKKINIFVQSDEQTPIIHGAIEQTKKYATHGILAKLLEQNIGFKISAKDIDDWEKILNEEHPYNPAKLSNKRQSLHAQWVKAEHKTDYKKNKTDKKKEQGWLNTPCEYASQLTNAQYYQQLCTLLDNYNWLENKLHFVPIRKLHNLLIDVLARLTGFINLLERDFQFLDWGASPYRNGDSYRLTKWVNFDKLKYVSNNREYRNVIALENNLILDVFTKSKTMNDDEKKEVISKIEEKKATYEAIFFKKNHLSSIYHHQKTDFISEAVAARNFIAHFNYLGQINDTNNGTKSILDLLSDVRDLMSYDRKLKNAVAKSFIDLLDKHGITITFKPLHENKNSHEFEIATIQSKHITHLGGAKIKTDKGELQPITSPQHHEQYIKMVRALLELKITPKQA